MENNFIDLCKSRKLKEAKRCYLNNPTIDISVDNEYAFRSACYYGQLKVAKWLLQIKPDINIFAYGERDILYCM